MKMMLKKKKKEKNFVETIKSEQDFMMHQKVEGLLVHPYS